MKIIAIGLVGFMILVSGCSTRYSRSYDETLNRDGERETTARVDYTYNAKNAQGLLRQAKTEMTEGNFQAAANRLQSVFDNEDFEDKYRAESLYQLGTVYSHLLNRDKDYTRAAKYYRQVIKDFPRSDWVGPAEEGLRRIEAMQEEL